MTGKLGPEHTGTQIQPGAQAVFPCRRRSRQPTTAGLALAATLARRPCQGGACRAPGTKDANAAQQAYFAEVAMKVVLFKAQCLRDLMENPSKIFLHMDTS